MSPLTEPFVHVYSDPAFSFLSGPRGGNRHSVCRLDILRSETRTIVVATELNSNPGASITNAAEQLWQSVEWRTAPQPFRDCRAKMYSVERYLSESKPTLDWVTFTPSGHPVWNRIPYDSLDYKVIEEALASPVDDMGEKWFGDGS